MIPLMEGRSRAGLFPINANDLELALRNIQAEIANRPRREYSYCR
jgi:hypothetical protein